MGRKSLCCIHSRKRCNKHKTLLNYIKVEVMNAEQVVVLLCFCFFYCILYYPG